MPEFDGPITGGDLRSMIVEARVLRDGRYRAPLPAMLEDLAMAASVLRGRVRVGRQADITPEGRLSNDRRKKATEALQKLAAVLPEIRAEIRERAANSPWPPLNDGQLEALDELAAAAARAWELPALMPDQEIEVLGNSGMARFSDAWVVPSPSPEEEISRWHHFAPFLADAFRDAVQASNRTLPRLGVSVDGPVPRFLAAVIPHITGETPNTVNVYQELKRAKLRAKAGTN